MTSPKEPRPGVDRAAVERLRRFADGETARTIYKLPPNGRFDPLRADIRAILSLRRSSRG